MLSDISTTKFAWLTDIHLNFLDDDARQKFYRHIVKKEIDGVFITGDIAEAPSIKDIMCEMETHIKKPIYFVLGNHDYYRGDIDNVRDIMRQLTESHEQLFWLPAAGLQQLSKNTILIGQDGWADGRLGDYQNSRVSLNDSRMIADLFRQKIIGKYALLEKMQLLADADALQLKNDLENALKSNPKKIIILTHVPPFKEACLHEGKISDDNWLPFFSSKIIGDVITEVTLENPDIEFLVLCGHTHSGGLFHPLKNLLIKAGAAEYYQPGIQEVLEL